MREKVGGRSFTSTRSGQAAKEEKRTGGQRRGASRRGQALRSAVCAAEARGKERTTRTRPAEEDKMKKDGSERKKDDDDGDDDDDGRACGGGGGGGAREQLVGCRVRPVELKVCGRLFECFVRLSES